MISLMLQLLHKRLRSIHFKLLQYLARRNDRFSSAVIPLTWPKTPNRIDLLNTIIAAGDLQTYLEIGCDTDECFSQIVVPHKVGVDPNSGGTVRATSDAFFESSREKFDLIFIDGLHVYHQVIKDIRNSIAHLNPGGVIVLHDCLPLNWAAHYPFGLIYDYWNGDVWRAIVQARTWLDVDTATCLIDHGLGIIKVRDNSAPLEVEYTSFEHLPYDLLAKDYSRLLRAMDYEEALEFAQSAPTKEYSLSLRKGI